MTLSTLIIESSHIGWGTATALVVEFGIRVALVLVLLARRGISPETRVTWIILILALPVIGVFIYLMVGETKFGRTRIRRHREILQTVEECNCHADTTPGVSALHEIRRHQRQLALLAEQVSKSGPLRGNDIRLLGDTTLTAHQIIEDIDASTDSCHLLFYIWLDDSIGTAVGEALIRAAQRGVACRVLVDAVGSRGFLKSKLARNMRKGGVHVVAALPANPIRALFSRIDLRNHRKLVIIDDRIAWTGSQNMADASFAPKPKYAPWVDCAIRLTGPVVKEIQILFIEDWFLDTDDLLIDHLNRECPKPEGTMVAQVVATGPNFFTEAATQLVQACIQSASAELVLTTPYFVPDASSIMNLAVAARRGVQVDLVVPHRNDSKLVALASRADYQALLDAGVRIHEFTGGLLHAKTITVDRETAFITSANLDRRSFNLNFEAGVLIYDTDMASELRFLQQSYLNQSILIDRNTWANRPAHKRMLENCAGLLSPLL